MRTKDIYVTINGEAYKRTVDVAQTLAEFLREELGLTGTKIGCNEGECGACTVIYNGKPVNSCLVTAAEIDGSDVLTIEGMAGDEIHPLQQAFLDAGAVQCGFCTPGMIMSAKAILDQNPHPTREYVRKNMEGNICRCTGYNRIIDGIMLAAERINPAEDSPGA
ncbi:MAG: (2Fe-2S)-binding protein [Lachnospiraceae bacterium]|jgi:carbon-monoxide dehydrogenase small subunit|nr:(2Fe-2S)-binding protein [Lachnospiraceae bacterium]MBR2753445.1 (2Fe-2S)-binding protein [Lachnospiraceae bacterium]